MSAPSDPPETGAARRVELIYFEGCPNLAAARANLRTALEAHGTEAEVREWKQGDPEAPDYVEGYASPTVLVDGRDVAGGTTAAGRSCRAEGAPSVEAIRRALA